MTHCAVEFQHVDILFTREQDRKSRRALRAALELLDAGGTRAQISEQLGVVVGVADANLQVESGQICVLMGLSGSGKSTLLRAANGLNPVTRGRVLLRDGDGQVDVASCGAAVLRRLRRARIAMVFQQFGLLPWRTVRDNVGFGLELRGEPAAQRERVVDEKLELVGLSPGPGALSVNCPAACSNAWAWRAPLPPTPTYPDGRAVLVPGSADPHQTSGRTAGAAGACQEDHSVCQPRSG